MEAGAKVMFVRIGDGQYCLVARTGDVADLAGLLQRPGQEAVGLEQMDEADAESAAAAGSAAMPSR